MAQNRSKFIIANRVLTEKEVGVKASLTVIRHAEMVTLRIVPEESKPS